MLRKTALLTNYTYQLHSITIIAFFFILKVDISDLNYKLDAFKMIRGR